MLVTLLRHGLALDRNDPSCPPDPERPLTAKGIIRTRRACRGLGNASCQPEVVLTSPYLRARQTAEIALDELGLHEDDMLVTGSLEPGADPGHLFTELERLGEPSALAVGHAPHLDLAIAHALGLDEPCTKLKKAGAACLELEGGLGDAGVRLVFLMEPRALRRLKKKAR
jgi:phosphohistidine phosphatase